MPTQRDWSSATVWNARPSREFRRRGPSLADHMHSDDEAELCVALLASLGRSEAFLRAADIGLPRENARYKHSPETDHVTCRLCNMQEV